MKNQQTLASWETTQSQLDLNTLFVLCDLYGASINAAFGFSTNSNNIPLSKEEVKVINIYRNLDELGKNSFCDTLEREFSYIETQIKSA